MALNELLQAYQHLDPTHSLGDTLTSLRAEDSHHPSLYYVLARLWVG